MTRSKHVPGRALLTGGVAVLLAAAAFAWIGRPGGDPVAPRAADDQPRLLLITTLPLMFGETFSLEAVGSPALNALEARYDVQPIGVSDAEALKAGGILLMAHPLAQPAEALVDLDAWVRGGGRVLILADPRLEWPSNRPLGDRLRPPPAFADTGLLAHWGLKLEPPAESGPVGPIIDGREVRALSAGTLSTSDPACAVLARGLVARCSIGAGKATVIADADFLNVGAIEGAGESGNLEFLLAELERLER